MADSDRILILLPDQPEELRDRGLLLERLECFPEAAGDLARSLDLAPGQPEADRLRGRLTNLLGRAGRLN